MTLIALYSRYLFIVFSEVGKMMSVVSFRKCKGIWIKRRKSTRRCSPTCVRRTRATPAARRSIKKKSRACERSCSCWSYHKPKTIRL